MSRALPPVPNLEHLKKEAKALLRTLRDANATTKLADAQHALAQEYGFSNWTTLKQRVLVLASDADPFAAFAAAVQAQDDDAVASILARHPALESQIDEQLPDAPFGETALIIAVQKKNKPLIDLLLGAGASINRKSHWWAGGFSPLDNAAPDFAPFVIERGATLTAYAAARLGMIDRLDQILRDDPQTVHSQNGDGQTPLHVAANVDVARLLLDRGADVNALDVDHESTAAMYHVRERTDVTRLLMSRGSRTDILMAAAVGDADLVRSHLDRDPGAIRTIVSSDFFPMKNPDAGGTIYTWTIGEHKSPHAVAREFGHPNVLQLLMDHTPDTLKLAISVELGDLELFNNMSAAHPGLVSRLTDDEREKIVAAAQHDDLKTVRAMLKAGWPADARRRDNVTALNWAAFHGNAEMARVLIQAGAPLDVVETTFGGTPFSWTLYGSRDGWHRETGDFPATLKVILDAGAVVKPTKDFGYSDAVLAFLRSRDLMVE